MVFTGAVSALYDYLPDPEDMDADFQTTLIAGNIYLAIDPSIASHLRGHSGVEFDPELWVWCLSVETWSLAVLEGTEAQVDSVLERLKDYVGVVPLSYTEPCNGHIHTQMVSEWSAQTPGEISANEGEQVWVLWPANVVQDHQDWWLCFRHYDSSIGLLPSSYTTLSAADTAPPQEQIEEYQPQVVSPTPHAVQEFDFDGSQKSSPDRSRVGTPTITPMTLQRPQSPTRQMSSTKGGLAVPAEYFPVTAILKSGKKQRNRPGFLTISISDGAVSFVNEKHETIQTWQCSTLTQYQRQSKNIVLEIGTLQFLFECKKKKNATSIIALIDQCLGKPMNMAPDSIDSLANSATTSTENVAVPSPAMKKGLFGSLAPTQSGLSKSWSGNDIKESISRPVSVVSSIKSSQPEPFYSPPTIMSPPVVAQLPARNLPSATALYDYEAQNDDELTVNEGDILQVVDSSDFEWLSVCKDGQTGLVPASYCSLAPSPTKSNPSAFPAATIFTARSHSPVASLQSPVKPPRQRSPLPVKESTPPLAARPMLRQEAAPKLPSRSSTYEKPRESVSSPPPLSARPVMKQEPVAVLPPPATLPRPESTISTNAAASKSHNANEKPPPDTLRSWSDRSQTFSVRAAYKSIIDGKVHIWKENGVTIAVPLVKMSESDLAFVSRQGFEASAAVDVVIKSLQEKSAVSSTVAAAPKLPTRAPEVDQSEKFTLNGFNWLDLLLEKAVSRTHAEQYALAFVNEGIEKDMVTGENFIGRDILRGLGVREGDIFRIIGNRGVASAVADDKAATPASAISRGFAVSNTPASTLSGTFSTHSSAADTRAQRKDIEKLDSRLAKNVQHEFPAITVETRNKTEQMMRDEEFARELQQKELIAAGLATETAKIVTSSKKVVEPAKSAFKEELMDKVKKDNHPPAQSSKKATEDSFEIPNFPDDPSKMSFMVMPKRSDHAPSNTKSASKTSSAAAIVPSMLPSTSSVLSSGSSSNNTTRRGRKPGNTVDIDLFNTASKAFQAQTSTTFDNPQVKNSDNTFSGFDVSFPTTASESSFSVASTPGGNNFGDSSMFSPSVFDVNKSAEKPVVPEASNYGGFSSSLLSDSVFSATLAVKAPEAKPKDKLGLAPPLLPVPQAVVALPVKVSDGSGFSNLPYNSYNQTFTSNAPSNDFSIPAAFVSNHSTGNSVGHSSGGMNGFPNTVPAQNVLSNSFNNNRQSNYVLPPQQTSNFQTNFSNRPVSVVSNVPISTVFPNAIATARPEPKIETATTMAVPANPMRYDSSGSFNAAPASQLQPQFNQGATSIVSPTTNLTAYAKQQSNISNNIQPALSTPQYSSQISNGEFAAAPIQAYSNNPLTSGNTVDSNKFNVFRPPEPSQPAGSSAPNMGFSSNLLQPAPESTLMNTQPYTMQNSANNNSVNIQSQQFGGNRQQANFANNMPNMPSFSQNNLSNQMGTGFGQNIGAGNNRIPQGSFGAQPQQQFSQPTAQGGFGNTNNANSNFQQMPPSTNFNSQQHMQGKQNFPQFGNQPQMQGMTGQQPQMQGMPQMQGLMGQQPQIQGMMGQQHNMQGIGQMPNMLGQQPQIHGMMGQMPNMLGQQQQMPGMFNQQMGTNQQGQQRTQNWR